MRDSSSLALWRSIDHGAAAVGDSTFVSTPRLSQDRITETSQFEFGQPPRISLLRGNLFDQHHQNSSQVQGPWQQQQRQQHPARPIHVSQSCLLIPVFLAAWWYYTKQCLRKVRGLLRNNPETHEASTEKFNEKFFRVGEGHMKWEDLLEDAETGSGTGRFVKWINRRNVRRRQAKHEMRLTSQRILSQDTQDDSIRSSRNERMQDDSLRSGTSERIQRDQGSWLETASSQFLQHQASAQWECLSDAGDVELCARRHSYSDQDDSGSRNVNISFHVLSGDSSLQSTTRSGSMEKLDSYVVDTPSLDDSRRVPVRI